MVPLELPQQLVLEQVAHTVLDQAADWTVALVPFATIPGCMLEVTCGGRGPWRVVLEATDPVHFQQALRRLVRSWCDRSANDERESVRP